MSQNVKTAALFALVALLIVFPGIATWLPSLGN